MSLSAPGFAPIRQAERPLVRADVVEPLAPSGTRKNLAEWSAALAALVLAALSLGRSYESVALAVTLAATPLVVWIAAQDLRSFTIPDGAVVALAALALAARVAAQDPALMIGLDLLLTGGVLLAFREVYFRRRGFDGLGLGDVKLAAAGGLLVGAVAFAWALLAASLLAIAAVGIAHLRARRVGGIATGRLAFGAFLAPAIFGAWLLQALPFLQGA